MTYQPFKSGTLLIPSGTGKHPDKKHLFVICTNKCSKNMHLLVPVTSWTNNLCDSACVLNEHEHSFIKHKSYVFYRNSRIELGAKLEYGVKQNIFHVKEQMNAQTLLRITNGFYKSDQVPRKILNYLDSLS